MKTKSAKRTWIIIAVVGIIVAAALYYFFWSGITTPVETISTDTTIVTPKSKPTPTSLRPAPPTNSTSVSISPISPSTNSPIATPFDPDILQTMIQQAIFFQNNGDYETVIETIDEVLAYDPNSFIAHNIRGNAYLALGDSNSALVDFTAAINIDPMFPHAYYNRGRLLRQEGDYSEAITDLERSIELGPSDFTYRANGNIGLIYHTQGKYDEALEAFNQSIAANRENKADVYYFRGETYTAMENYDAAIADYQAAIDRFSNYDNAYQSLGYALYKTEQLEPALEALNQASSISPNNAATYAYLALVNTALNKPDDSQTQITKAISLVDNLSEEEKALLHSRVSADLETLAKNNPDAAADVEQLLNLLSEQ